MCCAFLSKQSVLPRNVDTGSGARDWHRACGRFVWFYQWNCGIRAFLAAQVRCPVSFTLDKSRTLRRSADCLMKTLFLLRHAKSSWSDAQLKDFERPLNERGTADVPLMAERFLRRGVTIGSIITSPALRAKTTAKLFADAIGFPEAEVIANPELYFAGSGMFLKATRSVDEECDTAMLIGHNPAITDFANALSNSQIDTMPTSGLVELSLPVEQWGDIDFGEATLVSFDFPKKTEA